MRLRRAISAALLVSSASASTSSLTPPVLPLLVRNPYLSIWLGNARNAPWYNWPMFYTGQSVGFSALVMSPDSGTVYPLLGRPQDFLGQGSNEKQEYEVSMPLYMGATYDASTTNLTYQILNPDSGSSYETAEVILSFLSPVTPTSTLRQSIPAAYLTVYVKGSFDLNFFIDVNGQFVSGNEQNEIQWELSETAIDDEGNMTLKTWKIKRAQEEMYTEYRDRAEWGELQFTAPGDVRHESGNAAKVKRRFARTGTLQNHMDEKFRRIWGDNEPVFAFSKSFKLKGNSTSDDSPSEDSVLFTFAHIQDPVVQYASARGLTNMRPLWKSWFPVEEDVLKYHYLDFHNAKKLAQNYSDQLEVDAYASGSDNYVDIVALSARQIMGATSFSGTPENPILFLKEISSNGNCQTVDVIFPSFPFFLYTNPRWLSYLLEPLIEHQLSGQYPNDYSMHDLGTHFPNQTGHPDGRDEYMPVEECGDMLIMGLALVNSLTYDSADDSSSVWATVGSKHYDEDSEYAFPLTVLGEHEGVSEIDDTWGGGMKGVKQAKKWLGKSYRLWKQWTGYLVEYSLEPRNQLCTDDFAGWLALQTNLALKGIIGIKAMSQVAELMGYVGDAKSFRNISDVYVAKWEELGVSRDGTHAKLAYDWYGSWTTLYSLYADAVLCFHPGASNSSSSRRSGKSTPAHDHARAHPAAAAGDPQKPMIPPPADGRDPITEDFIPSRVYAMQSKWYGAVMQKYGLPLDSRHLYTKSDWEFEAAAVASRKVRAEILDRVARWLNETATDRPFADLYNTEGDGGFPGPNFFARPVVGGHFAFLTLERACGGRAVEGLGFLDGDDEGESESESEDGKGEGEEEVEWTAGEGEL